MQNKILRETIYPGVFIALIVFLALPASAQGATLAELRDQIAQLRARIATMQQTQTSAPPSGSIMTPRPTPGQSQDVITVDTTFTRNLARGSRGDDVRTLQQFLIAQNLLSPASATGFFGLLTEGAVKNFQALRGIVSSGSPLSTGWGSVGPRTRALIIQFQTGGGATWRPEGTISTVRALDSYVDSVNTGHMNTPATTDVSTKLTCGMDPVIIPPATHWLSAQGDDAGVQAGFTSTLGGVGMSFQLINPEKPGAPLDVTEARSAAGAGWQFASVATFPWGNQLLSNQSAGNSALRDQHGYEAHVVTDSTSQGSWLHQSTWTPHFSDTYNVIAKSPCEPYKDSITVSNGTLNISMVPVVTTAGKVISARHQYSLYHPKDENWKEWYNLTAFYMSLQVATQNNLRMYVGSKKSQWSAGPLYPGKSDFETQTVTDKNGVRHDTTSLVSGFNFINKDFTDADYFVFVWQVEGRDIAVVNYGALDGSINKSIGWPYCSDKNDPVCGSFALYTTDKKWASTKYPTFTKGSTNTFTTKYLIGTPAQVEALGFEAGATVSGPTASITVNGQTDITVNIGEPINYAWSSTNAVSATSTFTVDTEDTCNSGTGPFPWVAGTLSGTAAASDSTIYSCQAGHTYIITYTVTGATGLKASDAITVHVRP